MKQLIVLFFLLFASQYIYSQTRDTIRFETIFGLIKIPVVINGNVHYFLFDTGSEPTVLRNDISGGLKKSFFRRRLIFDSHNKFAIQPIYTVPSFRIGNSELTNLRMISFKNSQFFNCMGVEGILGIDVIKKFDWIIDFDKKYLIKLEPGDTLTDLAGFLPVEFYAKGNRPRIKLKIGDKWLDFLFDSGASTNDITKKDARDLEKVNLKSYDQISSSYGLLSLTTPSKEALFIVNAEMNEQSTARHKMSLSTISAGENKIGNAFWGKNRMYLSWEKQKLLFGNSIPVVEESFGIGFGLNNDTTYVLSLVSTEQISKSGIKAGDLIKTINGKTYHNNCDLLLFMGLPKGNEMTIETTDGRIITLQKQSLF